MLRYFGYRLLSFVPTLLILAIALFFLSKQTSGDPVELMLGVNNPLEDITHPKLYQARYAQLSNKLGLDRPSFYFSIRPSGYPDTLIAIDDLNLRYWFKKMLHQYGEWENISNYQHALSALNQEVIPIAESLQPQAKVASLRILRTLNRSIDRDVIVSLVSTLKTTIISNDNSSLLLFNEALNKLTEHKMRLAMKPSFHWHGRNNQFHNWFSGILQGEFGYSYRDGKRATQKIKEAIGWTLSINGIAIFIAFLGALLLGTYLGAFASPRIRSLGNTILYIFYAIPVFWLATLLVMFFTTPEYGAWTNLFPGIGVIESYEDQHFVDRLLASSARLFLPVLSLVVTLIAYLTRQVESSVTAELEKPYVDTLKAVGMQKRSRIWKHVLPNALFPIITLFSSALPFAVAGSVTIEYIFNIPGMGRLLLDSITYQDWNVVFVIVFLIGLLTLLGILLSDVLYALLDPRIRFAKR